MKRYAELPEPPFPKIKMEIVPPGQRELQLGASLNLVDIYINGETGVMNLSDEEDAPAAARPFAFSFLPAGRSRVLHTIRSGQSVWFTFPTAAIQLSRPRAAIEDARSHIWNDPDHPMVGIGEIARDWSTIIANGESMDDLLGEMVAVRLCQILHRSEDRPQPATPPTIQAAIEYIEANLTAPLHLADVAAQASLSQYHFARRFREATGQTVRRYVIGRRVETAREMIAHGTLPLAEIAYCTGFCSQSHMTESFRRILGTTPGAFRRDAPTRERRLVGS